MDRPLLDGGANIAFGNITISGEARAQIGIFNNQTTDQLIQSLPSASQARYNAQCREDDPLCLAGTRTQLLEDIKTWVAGPSKRHIFWLNGMAGTGKSTIARTLCHHYGQNGTRQNGTLGASFFFSRTQTKTSHAGLFFTTIAQQLAQNGTDQLRRLVTEAIKKEPEFDSLSHQEQWRSLIFQPLRATSLDRTVIIIDALDECGSDVHIKAIIAYFAELKNIPAAKVRVIITGRPEVPIRLGFDKAAAEHLPLVLHNIPRQIVDNDIRVYFQRQFADMRSRSQWLGSDWPGVDAINDLVVLAHGLFIYAATMCKFVAEDGMGTIKTRLSRCIRSTAPNPNESSNEASTIELDKLYLEILEVVVHEDHKNSAEIRRDVRKILGFIMLLQDPLPVVDLAALVNLEVDFILEKLRRLHSVLLVPDNTTSPIQIFHPSFREFILDRNRCRSSDFCIDEKAVHEELWDCSVRAMVSPRGLRQDICDQTLPGTVRSNVSMNLVHEKISGDIRYACSNWTFHCSNSGKSLQDGSATHRMLQSHILFWLETMSWLGQLSACTKHIVTLLSVVAKSYGNSQLAAFLEDARRFAMENWYAVDRFPLQLYASALFFAPSSSVIRITFKDYIPQWIVNPMKSRTTWGAELIQLQGRSSTINFIRFSPDGALLATCAEDRTVSVWDAVTGEMMMTFSTSKSPCAGMCFASDGSKIAVALSESTEIWDLATREKQNLNVSGDCSWLMRFSFDGTRLYLVSSERITVCNPGNSHATGTSYVTNGLPLSLSPDIRSIVVFRAQSTSLVVQDVCTQTVLHKEVLAPTARPKACFLSESRLVTCQELFLTIWDTQSWTRQRRLAINCTEIERIWCPGDSNTLAIEKADRVNITIHDAVSGKEKWKFFHGRWNSDMGREDLSKNGNKMAVASPRGAYILSTGPEQGLQQAISASDTVQGLEQKHRSLRLRLWNTATETSRDLGVFFGYYDAVIFSPSHTKFSIVNDVPPSQIRVHDGSGSLAWTRVGLQSKRIAGPFCFSQDDGLIAGVTGKDPHAGHITVRDTSSLHISVWDTSTGQRRRETMIQDESSSDEGRPTLRPGPARSVSLSSDSKLIAVLIPAKVTTQTDHIKNGPTDGVEHPLEILICSVRSGRIADTVLLPRRGEPTTVAIRFSPDDRYIACIRRDRTVAVWDRQAGAMQIFPSPHSIVADWAFSARATLSRGMRSYEIFPDDTSMPYRADVVDRLTYDGEWIGGDGYKRLYLPRHLRSGEGMAQEKVAAIMPQAGGDLTFIKCK